MTDDTAREFEAKTVDEAIIQAMKAFHADFEDLEIKVLSEGSKGFLGMGAKNARILARLKAKAAPFPVTGSAPQDDRCPSPGTSPLEDEKGEARQENHEIDETLHKAKEVALAILDLMGLAADAKIRPDGVVEIAGDGSGLIIGKHGQTLDALQFIVNRIVNKNRQESVYITLDTEGYRTRHIDHLRAMAIKMGQKARKTGQSVTLEKMNPYDRRIIHLALKDEKGLDTKSIGEGLYKKVVIIPKRAPRRK